MTDISISELLGKTLVDIAVIDINQALVFTLDDGTKYRMEHYQECCEGVTIEDITGNLADLIGAPILMAEESTGEDSPEGTVVADNARDYQLWTFYRLATVKGYVTIRWFGEGNGYYSIAVGFSKEQA